MIAASSGCYSGLDSGRADGGDGDGSADDDAGSIGDESAEDGDSEGDDVADPGRVTLHRLNRVEYNNTIRDLFWGLQVTPADDFPADDHSFGFDNIADVLSVTPLLFELYERAAEDVIEAAFTATGGAGVQRAEAEDGTADVGSASGEFWTLTSNGGITLLFDVETAGDYELRVRAYGQQAGPALPQMSVEVDGVALGTIDVPAVAATPGEYAFDIALAAGSRTVVVSFLNDYYDAAAGLDRNLYVDWVEIDGPAGVPPGPGDIKAKLLPCTPTPGAEADCSRQVLTAFAERAWRRPLTAAEIDALVELAEATRLDGDPWEDSIRLAMKNVLVSPHFLFRVEIDPEPTSLVPHPVGDYELASRLSYFLWSSMPDDELFASAKAGNLQDPEELQDHVVRMLADERAEALVANFAGQWLYFRAIGPNIAKDPVMFPMYDEELRVSMRTEMEMFFRSFVTEGRSLRELLTSDTTYVDARLAAHYGLPAPEQAGFVEVSLASAPRRGLLTQAGLMTVLSHPQVTSPVKRGKWVLEQLLCIPPTPPPPGVDADPPDFDPNSSTREQLEAHRANPECAVCHDTIDPLGLGLEHYDPVGMYRTMDGGKPIDASGNLPSNGPAFEDALGMATLLAESEDFASCTIRHTLTYALVRGVTAADLPHIDEVRTRLMASEFTLEDLVIELVTSDMFRMRRGEEASP
jgi:hypothetical protein